MRLFIQRSDLNVKLNISELQFLQRFISKDLNSSWIYRRSKQEKSFTRVGFEERYA